MVESELRSASANAVQADLLENVTVERRNALVDSLTRMWNRQGILNIANDAVLRSASRRMLAALRESDVVGRLGGDEFLLVLSPCESLEAAMQVAKRVRTRLSQHPIRTNAGPIEVSASFGTHFLEAGSNKQLDGLLEQADRAMYLSKRGGRNAVRSIGCGEVSRDQVDVGAR
jgi:predicted signal transduction protein with EAL and GGDEF domain